MKANIHRRICVRCHFPFTSTVVFGSSAASYLKYVREQEKRRLKTVTEVMLMLNMLGITLLCFYLELKPLWMLRYSTTISPIFIFYNRIIYLDLVPGFKSSLGHSIGGAGQPLHMLVGYLQWQ